MGQKIKRKKQDVEGRKVGGSLGAFYLPNVPLCNPQLGSAVFKRSLQSFLRFPVNKKVFI